MAATPRQGIEWRQTPGPWHRLTDGLSTISNEVKRGFITILLQPSKDEYHCCVAQINDVSTALSELCHSVGSAPYMLQSTIAQNRRPLASSQVFKSFYGPKITMLVQHRFLRLMQGTTDPQAANYMWCCHRSSVFIVLMPQSNVVSVALLPAVAAGNGRSTSSKIYVVLPSRKRRTVTAQNQIQSTISQSSISIQTTQNKGTDWKLIQVGQRVGLHHSILSNILRNNRWNRGSFAMTYYRKVS